MILSFCYNIYDYCNVVTIDDIYCCDIIIAVIIIVNIIMTMFVFVIIGGFVDANKYKKKRIVT